jgi:hypothetical protein
MAHQHDTAYAVGIAAFGKEPCPEPRKLANGQKDFGRLDKNCNVLLDEHSNVQSFEELKAIRFTLDTVERFPETQMCDYVQGE